MFSVVVLKLGGWLMVYYIIKCESTHKVKDDKHDENVMNQG